MNIFPISSSDFGGLTDAEDRYNRLLSLHNQAMSQGKDTHVVYEAGMNLTIQFPANGAKIMLTDYTDFNNATITITSDKTDPIYIFALCQNENADCRYISKRVIDSGDYRGEEGLASGTKLLVIKDNTKWIGRIGYSGNDHFQQRKDVILLKDGIAQNKTIQPYSTKMSTPQCFDYEVSESQKVFKNGNFIRNNSTKRFFLLEIGQQNNVLVENIAVTTYNSYYNLTADFCFRIADSTNVTFKDVTINGTYSTATVYGYGIYMNNVWNCLFDNLQVTNAAWGVFGTVNVNTVRLNDCSLNRFDVHCYGADITCTNVTFQNDILNGVKYNQLTCVYGQVLFEYCTFKSFTPVLFDSSFNAYTEMDVIFRGCTVDWSGGIPTHNGLVSAYGLFSYGENPREELKKKCLPNIIVRDLTFKALTGSTTFTLYIFNCGGSNLVPIDYLSVIDIMEITVTPAITTLNLYGSNMQLTTVNPILVRNMDNEDSDNHEIKIVGVSHFHYEQNILPCPSSMVNPRFKDQPVNPQSE